MRSLLRARRILCSSVRARTIHTENEIYKPAKGGTIPTMVGELICAMMEGTLQLHMKCLALPACKITMCHVGAGVRPAYLQIVPPLLLLLPLSCCCPQLLTSECQDRKSNNAHQQG